MSETPFHASDLDRAPGDAEEPARPDEPAAGEDPAGEDPAREDPAREDDATRDDAARDDTVGDDAVGDDAVGGETREGDLPGEHAPPAPEGADLPTGDLAAEDHRPDDLPSDLGPADLPTGDLAPPTTEPAAPDGAAEAEQAEAGAPAPGEREAPGEILAEPGPAPAPEDTRAAAVGAEAVDQADAGAVDAEELVEEPVPRRVSPYDRPGRWYVLHTQSGYEKKVKSNLESRIASMNMEDRIHEVVIPTEEQLEFKAGKKQVVQRKMFPGYVLVRCDLDDESWYCIRNTPNVTGFVGQAGKPSPLRRREVENLLQVKTEGEEPREARRPRIGYELGESVRVREGPFADFTGEIVEIDESKLELKVLVNIFGRETPVTLEFEKVAKL